MLFYLRMCVTKLYFFILCCCYCIFVFQKQKIPLYHTINVYIAVMENRIKKMNSWKKKTQLSPRHFNLRSYLSGKYTPTQPKTKGTLWEGYNADVFFWFLFFSCRKQFMLQFSWNLNSNASNVPILEDVMGDVILLQNKKTVSRRVVRFF